MLAAASRAPFQGVDLLPRRGGRGVPGSATSGEFLFQGVDLLATAATSGGELLLEAGDLGAARRRRGALGVERRLQRRRLVARGRRRLLRDNARGIRVQRRLLGRGDALGAASAPDVELQAQRAPRPAPPRAAARVSEEFSVAGGLREFLACSGKRRLALLERCLGLRRALFALAHGTLQ